MSARFVPLKSRKIFVIAFSCIIICLTSVMCKGPSNDEFTLIEKGFINPPHEAAPRVWWHWMNGNISREGISADLEWMKRVGIGGFQNFDAALATPQIVDKRLVYMTPEWKEAFLHATKLADSLGLEMAIAGSPGWSESGGPWVTPEQAMKKFVWTETRVEGGKPFNGTLPKPPSTTGTFQNLPLAEMSSLAGGSPAPIPEFYADAAVVAYRLPETDLSMNELEPVVTSSGGRFNLASLTNGDLATSTLLPYTRPGENSWIQFSFNETVTVQALTIVGGGNPGRFGFGADATTRTLEAGDDGKSFNKVTDIVTGGVTQKTLTFNPVTARYFRFTWKAPQASPFAGQDLGDLGEMFGINAAMLRGPQGTEVAELVLHTVKRIHRFEEKAAFATATDLYSAPTPEVEAKDAVKKDDVVDLTSMMKTDGSLEWTPPAGKWAIIRLGYSLTGHQNSPASPEATGLEVDKLSAEHVRSYFTNYLDQ
ncbi:MAG: discoidin domain-containing protein, partial [Bacteroidales bacterium]|nr:discoidin domain-containing protein [Bacteroidales bacterium]